MLEQRPQEAEGGEAVGERQPPEQRQRVEERAKRRRQPRQVAEDRRLDLEAGGREEARARVRRERARAARQLAREQRVNVGVARPEALDAGLDDAPACVQGCVLWACVEWQSERAERACVCVGGRGACMSAALHAHTTRGPSSNPSAQRRKKTRLTLGEEGLRQAARRLGCVQQRHLRAGLGGGQCGAKAAPAAAHDHHAPRAPAACCLPAAAVGALRAALLLVAAAAACAAAAAPAAAAARLPARTPALGEVSAAAAAAAAAAGGGCSCCSCAASHTTTLYLARASTTRPQRRRATTRGCDAFAAAAASR